MKSLAITALLIAVLGISLNAQQDVYYEFQNPFISTAGINGSFEVDVAIYTSNPFKLGSGQLYFTYNPLAFGTTVNTLGAFTATTGGHVLGQTSGPFPIYSNLTINDNGANVVSIAWQQELSSGCFSNNVQLASTTIVHLRFEFIAGGQNFPADICFLSSGVFGDQTFTACGPDGSCAFDDCNGNPGTQITNDVYDCTNGNVPLPLELLDFTALHHQGKEARLQWITDNEANTSHFEIERSTDANKWESIGQAAASGFTYQATTYRFTDPDINELNKKEIYYRLRMVDLDDTYEYSAIRSIRLDGGGSFRAYPNPAIIGRELSVAFEADRFEQGDHHLVLTDLLGRQIWSQQLDPDTGLQSVHLSTDLAPGSYFLQLQDEDGAVIHHQQLVVERE